MTASGEIPSNNTLFYNVLLEAVRNGKPRVDAYYVTGTIPPSKGFEGGTFQVDDFLFFMLKKAPGLMEDRRLERYSRTILDLHDSVLAQDIACIAIEITTREQSDGYMVARAADVATEDRSFGHLAEAALKLNTDDPFVYHHDRKLFIPDALAHSPLKALYEYLTAPQAS